MFRLSKEQLKQANSLSKVEKYILKYNKNHICFDLDFIVEVLPRLKNIDRLFKNCTLVLTEEIIHNLLVLKRQKHISARYAFNIIDQITQIGNLLIIPTTSKISMFKEYVYGQGMDYNELESRTLAYYAMFQSKFSKDKIVLFTKDKLISQLAINIGLYHVYYIGNE